MLFDILVILLIVLLAIWLGLSISPLGWLLIILAIVFFFGVGGRGYRTWR